MDINKIGKALVESGSLEGFKIDKSNPYCIFDKNKRYFIEVQDGSYNIKHNEKKNFSKDKTELDKFNKMLKDEGYNGIVLIALEHARGVVKLLAIIPLSTLENKTVRSQFNNEKTDNFIVDNNFFSNYTINKTLFAF